MPRITERGSGGRSAHTLSGAVGVSVLAHAVAIGALVTLWPTPFPAPDLDVIEVSIVTEQPPSRAAANNKNIRMPPDGPADIPAAPALTSTDPSAPGTASSPNWSGMDHAFDVPARPAFRADTQALAPDALAGMLDCLGLGGSTRGASGRPSHPPCPSNDPLLPAHVLTVLAADEWQPSEISAGDDYRNFKPIQPGFDESLFPDKVPPANRALEKWIGVRE